MSVLITIIIHCAECGHALQYESDSTLESGGGSGTLWNARAFGQRNGWTSRSVHPDKVDDFCPDCTKKKAVQQ